MQLVTDKAIFDVSLKRACFGVSIFFLLTLVLGVVFHPSYLNYASSFIGFIIGLLGNLALLFGCLWSNQWLVLAWLINALLFFISWPIAILGVIFNFGSYRQAALFDNVFLILLEYIVVLVVFLYCARLVYSYYHQLKNIQSNPQHSVVI